jgi:hypothetical protein
LDFGLNVWLSAGELNDDLFVGGLYAEVDANAADESLGSFGRRRTRSLILSPPPIDPADISSPLFVCSVP